jgi:hypothetical protein
MSNQTNMLEAVNQLRYFLSSAHLNWAVNQTLKRFQLPNGETISCVYWKNTFYITGTDIVRSLVFRFQAYGRPVKNIKKFEEGIFSDLRNLKPGVDAILEEPRSEFLEMLYKNNCIRTQKKQKVFFWFSVPHDRLFIDALERDHKREAEGKEPSTVALQSAPLLEAMAMNPQTKIPNNLKQYSTASSKTTLPSQQNSNDVNNYYINTNDRPQLQPINTNISQDKTVNMNYPMVQTQVVQMVQPQVYQQQVYTPVQNSPQVYNNAQYVISQPQNNAMMTPTSAVTVDQMTPTMSNVQVVNSPQIITYQQQGQIITTQVTPITTYAQEGLGQSEIKNGDMINTTPTMINTPIVYTTVSSTTQSSPVSLEGEEIVFGEQENKDEYIYACEVKGCGRRFKRAEFLRRHQRCHKTDSGYGTEMLQRQSSVSKLKIQAPYVIKTQSQYTPQTVSYIPSTGISTPISSHPISQMPSPPTNEVNYNVVVKNDENNMCKPISPNESTGAYYTGEVSPVAQNQASPIIVTTAGAIYTNDVTVTTSQNVNGSTLFPSITDSQTTYVQTPIIQTDSTTSVCQMPSPPLQYQPNYTQVTYQTQSQPVYTTTTPIY